MLVYKKETSTVAMMVSGGRGFSFNSHHYLQVKGMTMGTHMAPSYANLLMGYLEQDFLNSEFDKPSLSLRFIDDIPTLATWSRLPHYLP